MHLRERAERHAVNEPLLPEPFDDLDRFADWALEPERARNEKAAAASTEEIRAFYNAMMPRIDEILDYLEAISGDGGGMPAPAHRLNLMLLSLVEVGVLVELHKQRESVDACDPLRFVPHH